MQLHITNFTCAQIEAKSYGFSLLGDSKKKPV
jgi:hypothetical protein